MPADERRRAPWLLVLLVLVAAGLWWGSRGEQRPSGDEPPSDHRPDYTIENYTATVMHANGQKKYRLSAARLVHYPHDDTSHLTAPHLIQYPAQGQPVHTRANSAVVPAGAREIRMQGQVRVTRGGDASGAGGTLRADQLRIELDR